MQPYYLYTTSTLFQAHEGACEARVDILIAENIGAAFILPLEVRKKYDLNDWETGHFLSMTMYHKIRFFHS